MSSGKVTDTLRFSFCIYDAPEELSSHAARHFHFQEYDSLLKNKGIRKRTSSTYYQQRNGRAEFAVKSTLTVVVGCAMILQAVLC